MDERGPPIEMFVEGTQAQRREKQGDAWYSVRLCDGTFCRRALTLKLCFR